MMGVDLSRGKRTKYVAPRLAAGEGRPFGAPFDRPSSRNQQEGPPTAKRQQPGCMKDVRSSGGLASTERIDPPNARCSKTNGPGTRIGARNRGAKPSGQPRQCFFTSKALRECAALRWAWAVPIAPRVRSTRSRYGRKPLRFRVVSSLVWRPQSPAAPLPELSVSPRSTTAFSQRRCPRRRVHFSERTLLSGEARICASLCASRTRPWCIPHHTPRWPLPSNGARRSAPVTVLLERAHRRG